MLLVEETKVDLLGQEFMCYWTTEKKVGVIPKKQLQCKCVPLSHSSTRAVALVEEATEVDVGC